MKVFTAFAITLLTSTCATAAFESHDAERTPLLTENLAKCSGQLQAGYAIVGMEEVEELANESREAMRYMVKALQLKENPYLNLEAAHKREFTDYLYANLLYLRQRIKPVLSDCKASVSEARAAYKNEATRLKLAAEAKAEQARREKVAFDTEQKVKEQEAKVRAEEAERAKIAAQTDHEMKLSEAQIKAAKAKQEASEAAARVENIKQETVRMQAETLNNIVQAANGTKNPSKDAAAATKDNPKTAPQAKSTEAGQPVTEIAFRPLVRGSAEKKAIDAKITDYIGCSEYFKAGVRLEPGAVTISKVNKMALDFEALAFYTAKPHYAEADLWPEQDNAKRQWNLSNISNFWLMTQEQDGFCSETHSNVDPKTMSAARANFAEMHKPIVLN